MAVDDGDCRAKIGPPAMDQAVIQIAYTGDNSSKQNNIANSINEHLSLWVQSAECDKCSLIEKCRWDTTNEASVRLLVDTRYSTNLAVRRFGNEDNLCELREHFGEHGVYNLTIDEQSHDSPCRLVEISESTNGNLPILYVFIVYVVLWILYYGAISIRQYWIKSRSVIITPVFDAPGQVTAAAEACPSPEAKLPPVVQKKARLRSLDTFRGVSIVIMIFVNLGGGGYSFFEHSIWNGLTVADLVFPWFMFIMGTSMYLSISGAFRKQVSLRSIWLNIVRRSIILFLLGCFNNSKSNNDWRTFRIFGVLQRFGITYFITGTLLCMKFSRRRCCSYSETNTDLSMFGDLKALWPEWLLVSALVLVHTCITFLLPVPGCPNGYLGPGGLHDNSKYENCTGGATGYVDHVILTKYHMYAWPTCKIIYQTQLPFDPEGVLGCLTASLTVFLGVQAGATLVTFSSHRSRLIRWICWGLVCGIAAGVLCTFTKNDGWIPVNKNLWSLSYVLSMAAMSFIPLSVLYYIIDVKQWWHGAPFYQSGMNSIVLYMGHECFGNYLPFSWQPLVDPNTHAAQLAMNAWATTLFVVLAIYLHYRKIFISI